MLFKQSLISLAALPNLVLTPRRAFTVREGENIIIRCKATGFPIPEITWFKGIKRLRKNLYNKEKGTLYIKGIKFSDRGLYRCTAHNFVGSAQFITKITVEGSKTYKLH